MDNVYAYVLALSRMSLLGLLAESVCGMAGNLS